MRNLAHLFVPIVLVGMTASPGHASPLTWGQNHLIGGKAIALDLNLRVRNDDRGFGARGIRWEQDERFTSLERAIRDLVAARVEAAGFEFEADVERWRTTDRAYYETTGQPHYQILASVFVYPILSADGVEVAYAFEIAEAVFAEFADSNQAWFERFSRREFGGAVPDELSARVLDQFSQMLDSLFAPGSQPPPSKETRTFLEGRYSIDLIPPGIKDPREYFWRPEGASTRVEFYKEPRSENPLPLAFFEVIGLPDVVIDDEVRYLVLSHPFRGDRGARVTYEIRRVDGSVVRRFSTDDLLTAWDRWRLPRTPTAWVDSENATLVVEIPTCVRDGSVAGFDFECSDDAKVDIPVSLETGYPLDPVRDLLPRPVGQFVISGLETTNAEVDPRGSSRCPRDRDRQDFDDSILVPLAESWIPELAHPKYTEIAEKARITGRIELALLVEPSGDVACVHVIKGLPMGLSERSIEAALAWRFEPDPEPERLRQIRVVLTASLAVRRPPFD